MAQTFIGNPPAWAITPGGGSGYNYGGNLTPYSMPKATVDTMGGGAAGIESLTKLINGINLEGQKASNAARIPNNPALEQQSSQNIGSELRGELPADVVAMLGQRSAEAGAGRGMAGSPASGAAYLRALGLSSLDQMDRGQRDLSAADARNPGAPLYDPSQNILTPYQAASLQISADRNGSGYNNPGAGGYAGGSPGGYTVAPSGYTMSQNSNPFGYAATPWASDAPNPGAFGMPGESGWESLFADPATANSLPTGNFYADVNNSEAPGEGYLPVSQGSMYVGPSDQYNPESADWGDWAWTYGEGE